MVDKKKKKINKSVVMIAVLSVLVIAAFLFLTTNISFWFKKSIHDDAQRYATKHCLVFYPKNENGRAIAKSIAKGVKDDKVFDYSLIPYGDYYLVSYGNGVEYFVDKEYKSLEITEISDFGRNIIADYLRYTIKKELPETYYSSKFMEDSYIDNLDFTDVTYDVKGENLCCRFPNYDVDVLVPLKYIQKEINMNFGYKNELYIKPTYIDDNHPYICLTFDDGPQFWYAPEESSSVSIVETLKKYDATATFYVVGTALEEGDEWSEYKKDSFLRTSINNGNEYGSHTNGHEDLTSMKTAEGIKRAIQSPADYMEDLIGYKMTTYRPPGGMFDDDVLAAQPLPAILWNIDSNDWSSRNADEIYDKVLSSNFENGDIVLFHEIYDSTAEAIKKIVPELVNQGYQLVTVSEMLKYSKIDVENLKFYYNLNPPYYE